jgi:hypothetical protein
MARRKAVLGEQGPGLLHKSQVSHQAAGGRTGRDGGRQGGSPVGLTGVGRGRVWCKNTAVCS